MKPTHTLLITTALTLLMTGCSTEEKEKGDNTIAGTFTEITFNNGSDKVLLDNKQNLTWVNDIGGCFAGVANMNGTYCSDLNFAGSTNWRYPTSKELSSLFIRAKAEGVSLEYIVAGCAYATGSDILPPQLAEHGKVHLLLPIVLCFVISTLHFLEDFLRQTEPIVLRPMQNNGVLDMILARLANMDGRLLLHGRRTTKHLLPKRHKPMILCCILHHSTTPH